LTYVCEDCGFLFSRMGEVNGCPYCERKHIRTATEAEARALAELIKQSKQCLSGKEQEHL